MLVSGAAVLLAGCSRVIGPTPMQLYRLDPPPAQPADLPTVKWRLAVATPEAIAALDSDRIALARAATVFDYYADAAWTDRAPSLVQALLVRRFEDTGRILAVSRDIDGLRIDYLLETDIREFTARYESSGPPEIAVRIQAKLIRMPTREIVATLDADQRAAAGSNDVDAVVLAFGQALAAALDQIVAWTLRTPAPA